jgi:hypothetical protein
MFFSFKTELRRDADDWLCRCIQQLINKEEISSFEPFLAARLRRSKSKTKIYRAGRKPAATVSFHWKVPLKWKIIMFKFNPKKFTLFFIHCNIQCILNIISP